MKKKSIIAFLLACSFAFGAAAFTGCNVVGGDPSGDQNQTDNDHKNDDNNQTPSDNQTPSGNQTPGDNKNEESKDPEDDDKKPGDDEEKPGDDDKKPGDDGEKDPPKADRNVKFYSDGVLVDTKTVKDGEKVTAPTNVSKTGYSLTGWSTSAASGASYDFNQGVTSDLNLYAQWAPVNDKVSYLYAGNECAAFEWKDSNPSNAKVEYKLSTDSTYTTVDKALVRASTTSDIAGTARVDVVGLKGGANYDFKITPSSGSAFTVDKIAIASYDRSGYAHFGRSQTNGKYEGVGAYNDDGTPKSGAKIIYLTEENKNNVDGNETSIAQYLKNAANNSTPIIIRVVGTVGSATWNEKKYAGYSKDNPLTAEAFVSKTKGSGTLTLTTNSKTDYTQQQLIDGGFNTLNTKPAAYNGATCLAINGLTSKIMCRQDSKTGIWAYDSMWNDCSISNVKNVTIEGIGEDAEIFQWGFTFKNSSSIEVRNIHFDDYTEDGCSFEGDESSVKELSAFKSGNIWLHHNTFDEGKNYWDVCDEQDKGDGDGSTDFKGLKNITIAYNHYIQTHKTNLIGGSDSVSTASVTFHHNYYQSCNQRMPLGRQANMHMYNNYYSGSTLYSISLRAGAYAFIENCYFTEDASNHYPVELVKSTSYGTPTAKIINCEIDSTKVANHNGSGNDYLYIGTDRSHKMNNASIEEGENKETKQRFAPDFDTDSSLFYYKDGKSDVTQMLTAQQTKELVPKLAGVQKRNGDVTLGGTGSGSTGTGTETTDPNPNPNPNPSGEAQTITVIDDFSAANGETSYTITVSAAASKYFGSAEITKSEKTISANGNFLKLESATKINFTTTSQLPTGAKLVLTMGDTTGVEANKLPTKVRVTTGSTNTDIDIVDGKVTIDLVSGTSYILGRYSGETRIASISIVIPA